LVQINPASGVHFVTSQPTSQTIHFSQAGLMFPVVSYLQDQGVPIDKYLQEAAIPPDLLENQTAPLPRNLIFRFINAACDGEGIEDIGLLVGRATSLQGMGEVGEILLNAKTIHGYLQRGCELIDSATTGDYYWLVDEPEQIRFCALVSKLDEVDTIQNYLYLLLITINTIGTAIEETWHPADIIIPGMTSVTASKLACVLPQTKIICGGSYASFPIPNGILARPLSTMSAPVKTIQTPLRSDFLTSMTHVMKTLILAGQSDIGSAAEATGISTRTLQRNLRESGTSFTALLLQTRIQLAKQWIEDEGRSLSDIARALGYSDAANFTRAFRRHTGQSPRAYRKDLGRSS
jgi:AraC-like DNA-binding protein